MSDTPVKIVPLSQIKMQTVGLLLILAAIVVAFFIFIFRHRKLLKEHKQLKADVKETNEHLLKFIQGIVENRVEDKVESEDSAPKENPAEKQGYEYEMPTFKANLWFSQQPEIPPYRGAVAMRFIHTNRKGSVRAIFDRDAVLHEYQSWEIELYSPEGTLKKQVNIPVSSPTTPDGKALMDEFLALIANISNDSIDNEPEE